MKRGAPLRRTPLARGTSQLTRSRINPVSEKRRNERPTRDLVREACFARDKGCRGVALVPSVTCRGEHAAHEIAQRSVCPGSHLIVELTMELCAAHHAWIDDHIAEAHDLGMLLHSWDVPAFLGWTD